MSSSSRFILTPFPPVVTFRGVAWVRVGTTTRKATDAELHGLRERRPERSLPADSRLVQDCSLDDLILPSSEARHEAARLDDDDPETFPELEPWLVQQELGRPTGYIVQHLARVDRPVTGYAKWAQMARKPMFDLKQADGIGGGQVQAVARCRKEFREIIGLVGIRSPQVS